MIAGPWLLFAASAFAGDAVVATQTAGADLAAALKLELERSLADLHLADAPTVYHLRYQLLAMDHVQVDASLGGLVSSSARPYNALGVELRVGAPSYDNTGFGGWQNGFDRAGLPMRLTPDALRLEAWSLTDRAYKQAVEQYARKQAQFSPPPDYPGDYRLTGAVTFDGGVGAIGDADALRDLAVDLSAGFVGGAAPLEIGSVHVGHEAGWAWTLDSEGTSVRRPVSEVTLRAVAHLRTSDGMLLTDQALWTTRGTDALPAPDAMKAQVTALRDELQALASAPAMTEEYVGPVIFEDTAAADLFRYVLLPQLQGTPPEIPFDSYFGDLGDDADPVRLGRRVLPPGWTVVDDPNARPDHPGSYTHDTEGTPAQVVEAVEDGIVRDLLTSRVPRKGVDGSNGHGRAALGERSVGRSSLTAVTPPDHTTRAKLRKAAFKLARGYERDWILVVRRLQEPAIRNAGSGGGFVFFGSDEGEATLPPPVAVVRVFADGREEVLRGAAFASVERWVLRDIAAAGPQVESSFLAPPGSSAYADLGPTQGIPSLVSAPEVLVGEVEVVPMPGDPTEVPLLPPPAPPEPSEPSIGQGAR